MNMEAAIYERNILEAGKKRIRESGSLYERGKRCHASGNFPKALRLYTRAVVIEPRRGEIWLNLGLLHSARGNTEEALKAYLRAGKLEPGFYRKNREMSSEHERKVIDALTQDMSPNQSSLLLKDFEAMFEIQDSGLPMIFGNGGMEARFVVA